MITSALWLYAEAPPFPVCPLPSVHRLALGDQHSASFPRSLRFLLVPSCLLHPDPQLSACSLAQFLPVCSLHCLVLLRFPSTYGIHLTAGALSQALSCFRLCPPGEGLLAQRTDRPSPNPSTRPGHCTLDPSDPDFVGGKPHTDQENSRFSDLPRGRGCLTKRKLWKLCRFHPLLEEGS